MRRRTIRGRAVAVVGRAVVGGCLASCNLFVDTSEYRFVEGAGAQSASTTGGGDGGDGGGGAASGGGTACMPDCAGKQCGPDGCGGLCGDCGGSECDASGTCCAASWAINLPHEASQVALASDGASLYVGDRNGGVRRLRTCDGSQVAGSKVAALASNFWVRSLLRLDDTLYAAGFGPGGVGVYPLEPNKLEVLPSGFATLPGASYPGDPIRNGAVGASGTLIFGASSDGGGFIRFTPGSLSCRYDASADGIARGITTTSTAVVMGVMGGAADAPVTKFLAVPFEQLDPASCDAALSPTTLGTVSGVTLGMAAGKTRSFAALVRGDLAGDTVSVLARIDSDGTVVETVADPSPKLDGYCAVAADVTHVFVGGGENGAYSGPLDSVVAGDARVARYPFDFSANAPPSAEATIAGATVIWGIAQDAQGVYMAGQAPGTTGFVAKCSRELDCPVLPAN